MRIVVALGRKALRNGLDGGGNGLAEFAARLAAISAAGHELVITHATGPLAGWLAGQMAATAGEPYPHQRLSAEDIGMVAPLIARDLERHLPPERPIALIGTHIRVDGRDPAFRKPAAPVGPAYAEAEARLLAAERGWRIAREGLHWRRVIAQPQPLEVLEAATIARLVGHGAVVVCAGAGLPLVACPDGRLIGVEALIDNDAASALIARQLCADRLIMLTDVDALYEGWLSDERRPLRRISAAELAAKRFEAGTIGRKVSAALGFVHETGQSAGIGSLADLAAIVAGEAGTMITAGTRH